MVMDRRVFLQSLGVGVAGATLLSDRVRAAATARISGTALSPDVTLYSGAGGNVVALNQPEGLWLVDGGLAEHSDALLRQIFADTRRKRVDTLF